MKDKVSYHRMAQTSGLILSEGFFSEFEFKPHYHLDYHIGLVVDGVQKQRFQGKSVLLGPGRISVMPPGEVHDGQGHEKQDYCMRTFRIAPALFNSYFEELTGKSADPSFAGNMIEDKAAAASLSNLYNSVQHSQGASSLSEDEIWLNLFEPLLLQLKVVKLQAVVGGLSVQHINLVKAFCHANLEQKISLLQLASLCGMSRYQFLRRFEQSIGITPHNWLMQLRLEKACLLLRESGANLAKTAANVGFYDQSHFIRSFRQWYGVTPSQY